MKPSHGQEGHPSSGMRALCVLCSLGVLAGAMEETRAAPPKEPTGVITGIEFTGNKVTRAKILRQEMQIKEGDVADPVLIELSRQAIMDLGLFTSVRAYLEPRVGGLFLRIAVKEKYYILPVPKLNRDDDNKYSIGAEISFDNLSGLNQKLKLRYESEDADGQADNQKITNTLLSFTYPRVAGSAWLLHSELTQTYSPREVNAGSIFNLVPTALPDPLDTLYKKEAWTMAVQASRWLNPLGLSNGWQLGSGLVWRHNSYDCLGGDCVQGQSNSQFQDAQAVGVSLLGQYVDVRDLLFSRSGEEYGYRGELGAPVLGSDTHYTRHEFFYRQYVTFPERLHENIDIQAKLGLSSGDIFATDTYAYSLGGSKTLRGHDTGSFNGNSYFLLNIQYLRPFFGYYAFRGVLFTDIGNAYPSNTQLHLADLKWDIGVGFRWRLKSFVKIDLRVDAAYAHDRGEWKYFLGTNEIF